MTRPLASPRINAIATAIPACDVHQAYTLWAEANITDPRTAALFRRMTARAGIEHRYSVLNDHEARIADGGFYNGSFSPGTAVRMRRYAETAPELALRSIGQLPSVDGITHMVVASCTGFMAPGLDQVIARRLGLAASVERISIGFMGCYAGVTALRTAGHLVRSDPSARVLVLTLELCTLHMQDTDDLEALLAMGQFADGAAAALVTATGSGLALGKGLSMTLEESDELITWQVGDTGFAMQLSGLVPGRIADALSAPEVTREILDGAAPTEIEAWAVHPGGRSVLDAVERGLALPADALAASRGVLRECGNMSSATVLFVLERLMAHKPASGIAMAFGPGLALEGLRFGWADDAD
jgi:predicted naringenin-chalcone synthase